MKPTPYDFKPMLTTVAFFFAGNVLYSQQAYTSNEPKPSDPHPIILEGKIDEKKTICNKCGRMEDHCDCKEEHDHESEKGHIHTKTKKIAPNGKPLPDSSRK